ARPTRVACLRAECAQPHKITGFDLHPILVEAVDSLSFKDIKPMLHDMGFHEGDGATGLERNDVDVHVVADVSWIDEPRGCPLSIRIRHGDQLLLALVGEDRRRRLKTVDNLEWLANPMEAHGRWRM